MIDVDDLPRMLQLHQVGDHLYEGQPEQAGDVRNVVFGGQILAQMIMSAHVDRNDGREDVKEVKSIHAIFARAGDYALPIQPRLGHRHVLAKRQDHVTWSHLVEHRRAGSDPPS